MKALGYVAALVVLSLVLAGSPQAKTLDDIFEYISPVPGAALVTKETTLILRPHPGLTSRVNSLVSSIRVQGSVSGTHGGNWVVADDERTLIFKPHEPFSPGERVTVQLNLSGMPVRDSHRFEFTVSPKPITSRPGTDPYIAEWEAFAPPAGGDAGAERGEPESPEAAAAAFTLPDDWLHNTVTISDNPDSGLIFVSPGSRDQLQRAYLQILDNTGAPVFFRRVLARRAQDFKKHPNGLLSYYEVSINGFNVLDDTYTVVDQWTAAGGFVADFHDVLLLPGGGALIMIYDTQIVDMSLVVPGGNPAADVIGLVIQELDASKNVVFQWRSWDHFQITDATTIDLLAARIDYVHGNAFDIDTDGHILVSSRHLDEVTKINRSTGQVIWRMGGSQNQFTLIGDTEFFTRQHDIRRIASGNITLFNNGNLNTPVESRGVEYAVDEVNMTATLVWEFRNTQALFAPFTGSTRRLPNGNTFISWGALGVVTEVRPDGSKAFEMNFNPDIATYRAFRSPWSGVAAAPTLWTSIGFPSATLHFTKFGDDPNVAKFYVYQGLAPNPTTRVDSSTTNSLLVNGLVVETPYYFRVTAVDSLGIESPFSNEEQVIIPGPVPVLINSFTATGGERGVRLVWDVVSDEEVSGYRIYRQAVDGRVSDVVNTDALIPPGERTYTDQTARRGVVYDYALAVVLADGSEVRSPSARISFGALDLALHQNHPNPFNPVTTISFALSEDTHVTLSVFDVQGRLVKTLKDEPMTAGLNEISWDGTNNGGTRASSGVYFYRLKAGRETLTRKMMLLK